MLLRMAAVLLLALGSGCATKIYQGPTSGRAADAQTAIAVSSERAFNKLDVSKLKGRRVLVQVYGLTERFERDSPEEAYVRSLLVEKLLTAGAQLTDDVEKAQAILAVTLRAAGVDVIRREVFLIYVHHTFRALTSARVAAYDVTDKVATRVAFQQEVAGGAIYREKYWLSFIGPFYDREAYDNPDWK
jgi:hypothetical protein